MTAPNSGFAPPGLTTDLTPDNQAAWSSWISNQQNQAIAGPPEEDLEPCPQFYNLVETEPDPPVTDAPIRWTGFPNIVKTNYPGFKRFEIADSKRSHQDEYLEWSVKRDPATQKIVSVVFCNEGPEYWEALSRLQPDTLFQLYKDLNPGAPIQESDLWDTKDGEKVYNPKNKWNNSTTTGTIAHLIQQANTLSAEITLAAQATIIRKDASGKIITDKDALIKCSQYGQPLRNSDPHIGASVNSFARDGYQVTLTNPVGLYIDSFDGSQFIAPDDADVNSFWRFTRGNEGHYMRAVFEVPPEKGYVVGDLTDLDGNKIQYGSQLADFITVRLSGTVQGKGKHLAPAQPCVGASSTSSAPSAGQEYSSVGKPPPLKTITGLSLKGHSLKR